MKEHRRIVLMITASAIAVPGLVTVSNVRANVVAGSIARVSGVASVKAKDGKSREAKTKDAVHVEEIIITEADGQVLIRMNDKVTAGAIRAVSGQIAREKPANVKYSAGTATIGIRGTDIEVAIIGEGQQDRSGIYHFVYAGSTEMRLDTGEVVQVEKELTGFSPAMLQPGEPRLQILRDRPAFLQSSGFDVLMQQLTNPRIPMIR
ncbi:MAG: hypothetical protein EBU79_00020 [Betaproteobacteria bacterium]|nr:hypothetical protein [Betaproteobacteria bacterium]